MADLEITGLFDPSNIVSGIQEAASAIEAGAGQIVGSFTSMEAAEAAFQSAGLGASNLITQLTGITDAAEGAATTLGAIGPTLPTGQFLSLQGAFLGAAEGASSLVEQLTGLDGAVGIVAPEIAALDGALAGLVGAEAEATAAVAELGGAVAAEGVEIAAATAPLADANGQLLLFTEAEADATGQTLLFSQVASETVGAEEALAGATAEAASAASQYAISVEVAIPATGKLAEAVAFLNNEEAVMAATQQEVAEAQEIVRTGAARLNAQLINTAEGWRLVALAEQEVVVTNSALTNGLATAAARLGATSVGAGQFGYALGQVARSSSGLASILAAAFPIIGIVAAIEVVSSLIDKFDQIQQTIRKTVVEFDNLASASVHSAEGLELQSLKLEDTISKLAGGLPENRLKEALLEDTIQAQQLSKSLEDATEKALELLKSGQVGFFKSLLTGQESTTVVRDALEKPLTALEDAQRRQQVALLTGNEQQRAAADEDVKTLRDAALKKAEALQQGLAADIKARTEALEKQRVIGAQSGVPITAPGLAPAEAKAAADEEFRSRSAQIQDIIIQLKNQEIAEENLKKVQGKRDTAAILQTTTDEQNADKIKNDALAKAHEDSARLDLELARSTAQNLLTTQEARIKLEEAAEIAGGRSKEDAAADSEAKLLKAKQTYYSSLLTAQANFNSAERRAIEEQAATIELDLVGANQEAARTANQQKMLAATEKGQAELAAIMAKQDALAVETAARISNDETAARTAGYKRAIDDAREQSRLVIAAQNQTSSEAITAIKASADSELNLVKTKEQLHVITAQQALDERLAIIEREKIAIDEAVAAHVAALEEERQKVGELWEALAAGGASAETLKKLRDAYDTLSIAIGKAGTAQENLNSKLESAKVDAAVENWKSNEKAVTDFVTSSNNALNGFVENVLTTNNSIMQSYMQMVLSIERSFIQMILKMIEQTALFQSIENKIRGVFTTIFRLPPAPPAAAGAAGTTAATDAQKITSATTTSGQIVALQQSTNAQLAALYQQDAAAYAAAQAQKTGQVGAATATAESAQTSAAATGAAARTTIATTEAASKVGQTGVKVAAHATGEAAQTAATGTGEAARTSLGLGGLFAHIARTLLRTITHATGVAHQTAATAAGQAAETTVKTTGQAAQTGAVIAGQTAQTAAVTAGGAARTIAVFTENELQVASEAGVAAAAAFASVMETVPFPANVAIAPAVAAETMGEVFAFGFAEKGALLDSDMPVFAHANEMILPSDLSTGVQNLVDTGGGPNNYISDRLSGSLTAVAGALAAQGPLKLKSDITSIGSNANAGPAREDAFAFHYHAGSVSALDRSGFQEVINRHPRELTNFVHSAIKRGAIDPRKLLNK